eukprot:scaffold6334_cov137-Isochrysis_galbana.AAC.6
MHRVFQRTANAPTHQKPLKPPLKKKPHPPPPPPLLCHVRPSPSENEKVPVRPSSPVVVPAQCAIAAHRCVNCVIMYKPYSHPPPPSSLLPSYSELTES